VKVNIILSMSAGFTKQLKGITKTMDVCGKEEVLRNSAKLGGNCRKHLGKKVEQ
jgi:hypothetical protein